MPLNEVTALRRRHPLHPPCMRRPVTAAADRAAAHGIELSIELHRRSIADNSWSLIKLLALIDRPNVGANPDAANTYWAYETAEESFEDAITALAPRSNYWHCRNLTRVHIPDSGVQSTPGFRFLTETSTTAPRWPRWWTPATTGTWQSRVYAWVTSFRGTLEA